MKPVALGLATSLVAILALPAAAAAAVPGRDEATALVNQIAAAFAKDGKDGKDKLLADVSDPAGPYVKPEGLYAYCMDYNNIMLAHGANKGLIGRDTSAMTDPTGLKMSPAMVEIAKGPGSGWIDYQWVNPTTKKIEAKTSFVRKIGADFFCAAGIYK